MEIKTTEQFQEAIEKGMKVIAVMGESFHELGESISVNTEHNTAEFEILAIEPAPPDQGPPEPSLPSESAIETAIAD